MDKTYIYLQNIISKLKTCESCENVIDLLKTVINN